MIYISKTLTPESTPFQVLMRLAFCPSRLEYAHQQLKHDDYNPNANPDAKVSRPTLRKMSEEEFAKFLGGVNSTVKNKEGADSIFEKVDKDCCPRIWNRKELLVPINKEMRALDAAKLRTAGYDHRLTRNFCAIFGWLVNTRSSVQRSKSFSLWLA